MYGTWETNRQSQAPSPEPASPDREAVRPYTGPVMSQADGLRVRTMERVLALSVPERIALALALGDEDLALFVRTSGLELETARRRLRSQRQYGRVPSACASAIEP